MSSFDLFEMQDICESIISGRDTQDDMMRTILEAYSVFPDKNTPKGNAYIEKLFNNASHEITTPNFSTKVDGENRFVATHDPEAAADERLAKIEYIVRGKLMQALKNAAARGANNTIFGDLAGMSDKKCEAYAYKLIGNYRRFKEKSQRHFASPFKKGWKKND